MDSLISYVGKNPCEWDHIVIMKAEQLAACRDVIMLLSNQLKGFPNILSFQIQRVVKFSEGKVQHNYKYKHTTLPPPSNRRYHF